jgi:RNA polymerase sigma factor (sigma-70 family)
MAVHPLTELAHDVGQALLRRNAADLTDAQLLTRFTEHADEAAFEALFRRHAPMVLGTCRRLLHNEQDAEDALQAVFLILARKAATVRPREALANWLYGVAYKAALKARSAAARRKERQVADLPEPPARHAPPNDLWPVLDRELNRLPARYRAVLVVCDLEGQTRREAARQLGCPEGTVCGRLARARALLARRLTRCGVPLMAVALEVLLGEGAASACVTAPLLVTTMKAVGLRTRATAAVSSRVLALVHEVRRALFVSKLKVTVVTLLVVAALGAGAVGLAGRLAPGADWQVPVARDTIVAPTGAGPAADTRREDRLGPERLQGKWALVSLVQDGVELPNDQTRDIRLELTDKVFRSDLSSRLFRQAAYTIDPSREPKWMDVISPGGFGEHVCRCIYRMERDQLTLCITWPGGERPTRFESRPGSGITLTQWRRAD